MYYIYCYTNKINNHKYVGQTNNLSRRIRQHRSAAFNKKASSYNDLIHKKIREYGEQNFEISVLEKGYNNDINYINSREQFWVEKLQSFRGTGLGYNSDHGGCNKNHSKKLTDEEIQEIKDTLKKDLNQSFLDIQEKYNISASFLSSINHGYYFYDDREKYPLRKFYKDNSAYDELIELLLNSNLSLAEIARQLNLGYSTVKKINAGTLRHGLYPTYPIRKQTPNEIRAKKIKELLMTTNFSNSQIAKIVNISYESVRKVKNGQSYYDSKLSQPLKPVTTIPSEIGSTSIIDTQMEMDSSEQE